MKVDNALLRLFIFGFIHLMGVKAGRRPFGNVVVGRDCPAIKSGLDKIDAANISVRIDNGPVLHPKPLRSDVGMLYGFELGSFDAILPALSRGKQLQISIPDKPERTVDLDIGAGGKAVAFLRKCDMYWTNFHIATDAWERGRASAKVGEYARAIEDFDQAIQKLPKEYTTKRARILYERGQAKLRKGDKTGGNADARAATKLRRWIATMDDINPMKAIAFYCGGGSGAARPQCDDADDDGREGGRMKLRYSDDLLRDPSRRFAIAGIVLASALACLSGGAFGAEMPKELWGHWCHKDKGWVRCKGETWDGLCCFIDRREMASEETRCKTLSVRKVKDHTVQKVPI